MYKYIYDCRGRRASGLVNKQTQMEERLADCWQKVIGQRVALSGWNDNIEEEDEEEGDLF